MTDNSYDPWLRIYQTDTRFDNVNLKPDDFLSTTPIGAPSRATAEVFGGINHRGTSNSVPMNKDYYGLAFFTRPEMNLTTRNLLRDRRFTQLLTNAANSVPRAIRAYLDFKCNDYGANSYASPIVDQRNIFIPLLTNHLISMGGWQDIETPTFASDPGIMGEQISMVDGTTDILRVVDVTCNFRNMPGNPILTMMRVWQRYMSQVAIGRMLPHTVNMRENTKDYETRIFRVILDSTKRYVQDIASFLACYPVNSPTGARFNFESQTPLNRANDQISITFRGSIMEYSDDILIHEFNQAVQLANADMADDSSMGDSIRRRSMVKVPGPYLHHFNYGGYPRINPATFELEWWVDRADWNIITGGAGDYEFSFLEANDGFATSGDGADAELGEINY